VKCADVGRETGARRALFPCRQGPRIFTFPRPREKRPFAIRSIDKSGKRPYHTKQGDYDMGLQYIGVLIPFVALSIPILAITLSYKQKTQKNRIRELELQKEILELENEKQNIQIKLLEEEGKKYDKIINAEE
jgi:hypothetical protein